MGKVTGDPYVPYVTIRDWLDPVPSAPACSCAERLEVVRKRLEWWAREFAARPELWAGQRPITLTMANLVADLADALR